MADTKISALDAISSLDGTDEFVCNDAGTTKKASATQIATFTSPSASDTVAGLIEIAVQSEQESGSDNTRAVTPGRQRFHPSAVKFWAYAGVGADLDASYNMDSVADGGTGIVSGTITTDFSSAVWCGLVSTLGTTTSLISAANAVGHGFTSQAAGTWECRQATIVDGATAACSLSDPVQWSVMGFGDQ